MYLSPYVEEPLNSKVIKSFVPEQRSRKCFSCFEFLMFYVHMLRTLYVHFAYPDIWLWYPGYRAEIWLGQVYLQEALDNLHSLHVVVSAGYFMLLVF